MAGFSGFSALRRSCGVRHASLGSLVLTLALLFVAVPAGQAASPRPFVYAISIDGLDGDRVDQGRAPFISSLLAGQDASATYYRESRSVMIAETNPNHVAMATGAYGNASGLPGNAFALYSPLESEDSCRATGPENLSAKPTETNGQNPNCLLAQTVFEAIKRQGNPDDLVTAAIFGKPKLGRIFAGKFFNGQTRDADYLWAPCDSGADDDDYCGDVPKQPATGYAIDDKTVMDQVLRTIRNGVNVRGRTRRPNFTFVNLHQVDSAGHATGTGPAYDTAIGQADAEIRRLVSELRGRGDWQRSVLVLLSDHSMDTTPVKTSGKSAIAASGVSDDDYTVVQNGSVDAIYLNNRTRPDRFDILRRMRAAALANPNVSEALYREPNPADGGNANTIDGAHPGWHAAGPRSADLFLVHKPGGAFGDGGTQVFLLDNPLTGNHGGPQTRDNFFAVVGGAPFVRQGTPAGQAGPGFDDTLTNRSQAENVDAAGTVMGLFGLFHTRNNAGRYLSEAISAPAVPGRAAPSRRPSMRVRQLRPRPPTGSLAERRRVRFRTRFQVIVGPAGGRYDIQIRSGRRWRALLTNSARRSRVTYARIGVRYRFRARLRAASSVGGPYAYRTVTARRLR